MFSAVGRHLESLLRPRVFASAPISAPFPIPISLRVLRHRFVCLHDRGRVDEIGKTPQVQSVSSVMAETDIDPGNFLDLDDGELFKQFGNLCDEDLLLLTIAMEEDGNAGFRIGHVPKFNLDDFTDEDGLSKAGATMPVFFARASYSNVLRQFLGYSIIVFMVIPPTHCGPPL
ncbi:hypothetical protein LSAT2_028560 [Lamellibrachia satsuma]|nr:hypothetical protein LSAT2_028560 [Lamellibrachia satsuma]